MIKFFRRIRRKLLQERKLKNYFLYAVGEILLIVVGILLALQLNAWREQSEEATLELATLKALHQDLTDNLARIENVIHQNSLIVADNQELMKVMKDPSSIYSDSLSRKFARIKSIYLFHPKRMAYESLKTRGFEVIGNDTLRSKLVTLFEETYATNENFAKAQHETLIYLTQPMIIKYLEAESFFNLRPNDFEELKNSKEYINYLAWIIARMDWLVKDRYKALILQNTLEVNIAIEQEMKKFE